MHITDKECENICRCVTLNDGSKKGRRLHHLHSSGKSGTMFQGYQSSFTSAPKNFATKGEKEDEWSDCEFHSPKV